MRAAHERLVLALYPSTHGFGFVLFLGPEFLPDWGTKETRWKDKNFLAIHRVKALLRRYQPEVLVLQDPVHTKRLRHKRIRALHTRIVECAEAEKVVVRVIRQKRVHEYFGATTKQAMAEAVARQFPMLATRMPAKRKIWQSEDLRQSLFDAAALGLYYFNTVQ
jgi:hypothetical protein